MALCVTAAARDPAEIRSALSTVTRDLQVQSRLPADSASTEAPPDRSSDAWSLGSDKTFSIPGSAAVFGMLSWVIITIAAIGVLAAIASVFREPLEARLRPAVSGRVPLPDEPPPPADPRDLLAHADQLAAAGQYAEAMHSVLLAATTVLGRGKPRHSADSLTSWELLREAALPPPQLDALRDLVIQAERAWFGQRPAGPENYRNVRSRYDVFAESI